MNKARELFERYVSGGASYIEQIAKASVPETLHLDFKEVRGKPQEELPHYAKALSAFTNSEGGIVVWGVECRSTGNGDPDTTKGSTPIKSLAAFVNLLDGKAEEYLQPGVNGIVNEPLPLQDDPDTGYVVTYIPRSEGPPQMSIAKAKRGFYCRMASNSRPMEHYQIADRFRERPQPRLEVFLNAGTPNGLTTLVADQQIDICVRNVGAGIAKDVALSVRGGALQVQSHSNILPKLNIFPVDENSGWRTFALSAEEKIYPGSFSKFVYFTWAFRMNPDDGPLFAPVTIAYRAFCDGSFVDGSISPEPNKPILNSK